MKTTILLAGLFLLIGTALPFNPAAAADFSVTITNTTHGAYFTPLLISAHADTIHLFELGQPASPEIQAMAEGGDISGLETAVGGADDDTVANPAAGVLGPGASVSANLNTDTTGNPVLSLVAMILPTNDGFVGLDSLAIPQTPGTYVYYLNAYDAGTEANDERLVGGAGGAPGIPGMPADPGGLAGANGTGVTAAEENSTVHIHRGGLGDTDASGGISDLDSTVHRWLNPVAKLVIDVR
jgi:hypothetical protein